ncbi:response regulator [Sphingomonas koreensis]|jgi:signal transduction histidine kinase/CheY-like chemotaxis protein/CHASE3 domain sensor protein|uniref:histidine kinase n=3 Tax=Alphaproteobacteria TaxID=28211 RepID=A0A430CH24_9SPHN|nr:Sensor histidine kinase RcsC [Sphingomonas paucimobilis]RSU55715.1 response regulator [Sphingomonas koreensis]TAJ29297.1 MAG: response regulator [Bosea sp. (in: a-proteobacteria)]THG37256.1 response regulator [Sphingomonas olei]RSU64262.1 response regulator [Sphingomonas koreensis]|tara:strand:- start:31276 stop:34758 length:3483 start_codon:yes stop_codon:yes gene_type:complete
MALARLKDFKLLQDAASKRKFRDTNSWWSIVGLVAGIGFFLVSAILSYSNVLSMRENEERIRVTHEVLTSLDELMIAVLGVETGSRGYVLTGKDQYLEAYRTGAASARQNLGKLEAFANDNAAEDEDLDRLRTLIDEKLRFSRLAIETRRDQGFDPAIAMIDSDQGKIAMDAIRLEMAQRNRAETTERQQRIAELAAASSATLVSAMVTSLIGIALTIAIFLLLMRGNRLRERQRWLQTAQVELSEAMRGEKTVPQLGAAVLAFLAERTGANAGAIFKGEGGTFNRAAMLGVTDAAAVPETFAFNEGLLGKVAADGHPTELADIPDGYLKIGSALGSDTPRHLVVAPAFNEGSVNAVIELGFFDAVDDRVRELLDTVSGSIGVALRSARFRERLQDALEETQRQASELQAQSEELRVSNEELEEQGNALKETQARLELQQVELEQTNSQLEEQAQALEGQRDELSRAAASLQLKARELEQASQYKSDFLANMSHELRTPLNSLLILSKLLGDNADGNLSAEQVKFARTIESSGNDLLTLINDILDLSKIEAGHVEIQATQVSTERLASDLRKMFEPLAQQRGLELDIALADDAPRSIETDRQRLEQVLKNLLSNAIKFTERGSVTLSISSKDDDQIEFAVADTGIGIAPEQRDAIFDAFRQADGTISRKFGGTGLGLSISRELVRLLGGTIRVTSEEGKGSTFIVDVPATYDPATVAPRAAAPAGKEPPATAPATVQAATRPKGRTNTTPKGPVIDDDRAVLSGDKRVLLVIEDDSRFAGIVCDLSREMGFECLVAGTAQEAIDLAREYRPSAIVLDIGLPDQSGLTVLDRLKHEDRTRHIPIHVISGSDQAQTAMALGAIGFLEKPAPRERLAEVLAMLQQKLASRVRRVLIVEDDAVQREAVSQLLGSQDVETVGVGTVAECLEELRGGQYDCMVLDLALPDATGFSLLETLSEEGEGPLPPVIVYTGRDLSADEEQRLRRYSSSIIIKGAKSPERLLDEVSLFLHQVVSDLPAEQRQMIEKARHRDAALEGRRILIVEDDVRNVYSLTSVLEPRGALTRIARNGQEAIDALEEAAGDPDNTIDLVLMDVMMPVMDGLTAARAIRADARWKKLPIVMLTAKAMPDDQQKCIDAGANDYMSKPIDVDKLLSLVRVWMPR